MTLSVVIPVFNEAKTVRELVRRVLASPVLLKEIVIVDDASSDGTLQIIENEVLALDSRITLYQHSTNQGKGAALRTGFSKLEGDIVLIQDADLEYDPQDYPRLLQPIIDQQADVVYGSRFLAPVDARDTPTWQVWCNRFLTALSNFASGLSLTDMETCYKVFRSDVLAQIRIQENRFGFEPEMTAKLARLNCRICEVEVSYSSRSYAEGKKITWLDAVWAIGCIVKYNWFWKDDGPQ